MFITHTHTQKKSKQLYELIQIFQDINRKMLQKRERCICKDVIMYVSVQYYFSLHFYYVEWIKIGGPGKRATVEKVNGKQQLQGGGAEGGRKNSVLSKREKRAPSTKSQEA